jgi:hypothetical protein
MMGKKGKRQKAQTAKKQTSQERHARDCQVCNHKDREQIEQEFIGWGETTGIAKDFNISRKSIYRHAEILQLYPKRRRNVTAALERVIEKAESVDVTASAIVAAVQSLAKINANGQWVERVEHVDLRAVFNRMSREELEIYARESKLPVWVDDFLGGTRVQSIEEVTGG